MTSNTDGNSIKVLLASLLGLYSRLSALILNQRMTSYRKGDSALLDKQILAALYDIVEKTPAPETPDHQVSGGGSAAQADKVISDVSNRDVAIKARHVTSSETPQKGPSNRLHATLSRMPSSIHLGEKLSVSAWDHIRTSLRYVHEKNVGLAKMHADLANEALKQASHYMTDEEYIELKVSVLEELQKLSG
jgi:hypothetical protein